MFHNCVSVCFFKCPLKKSYRMQLTASSLLLSEGRGKIKSFPTRYWQWWSTQQALKCFFKHLINVNSVPSPMTDVRDTAGKKSDVPALEEQITTTKGERDSLKWAKEGCTNCCVLVFLQFLVHARLFLNSGPWHILFPWPEMFFPSLLTQLAPSCPRLTFSGRLYLIILTKGGWSCPQSPS